MRRYRVLADLLTELRLIIGLIMIAAAWSLHLDSLPILVICQLLSWTSDILDGPLARRAPLHPPGFLGRHDLEVDVFQAICLLVALVASGRLNPAIALVYAFTSCVILLLTHYPRALAMALQGPVYTWLIAAALHTDLLWGLILVGWIALAIVVTWPRFPRVIVPEFLAGMAAVGTHLRDAWQSIPWGFWANGNNHH